MNIYPEFPIIDLALTGKKLKMLRIRFGYTVKDLAEYLGFTTGQAIYNWESGKALPTLDNLNALTRLYRVYDLRSFLAFSGEAEVSPEADASESSGAEADAGTVYGKAA